MNNHESTSVIATQTKRIALVGNPNTGKTTLFNALTGLNQKVGNYPGVTVERKAGRFSIENTPFELIDLPGTYSLAARSLDEMVVNDVLLGQMNGEQPVDLILAIVDASNLTRNFYLISQLLELGPPVLVALNMTDIAQARGMEIDSEGLCNKLGIPLVPICASRRKGIDRLRERITQIMNGEGCPAHETPIFPEPMRLSVYRLKEWINQHSTTSEYSSVSEPEIYRALIDSDGYFEKRFIMRYGPEFKEQLREARASAGKGIPLAAIEAKTRYGWISHILKNYVKKPAEPVTTWSDRIDQVLTHRVFGSIVFVLVMALIFQSIYTWAGPVMDLIDGGFSSLGTFVMSSMPAGALRSLIVDGVIAGVGGVLVFLPQIAILFFFIAILEDCGYLPRAAFLMDKLLSRCGLSGKSFIPMLSSFACAVPGIMATRTIESRRDRLATILIAPLMSCSARLPVYLLFIAVFIPNVSIFGSWIGLQGLTLFCLYILGILVAIPIAWIIKKTLIKGENAPFVLELPSYKLPNFRSVFFHVYLQSKEFIVRAGTVIFCVAVVVWALAYFPHSQAIEDKYASMEQQANNTFKVEIVPLLNQITPTQFDQTSDIASITTALNELSLDNANDSQSTDTVQTVSTLYQDYQDHMAQLDKQKSGEFLRSSILGQMGKFVEPLVQPVGWDWRIGMAVIASFPAREVVIATLGTIFNMGSDADESSGNLRTAISNAENSNGGQLFNIAIALSIMVFFALCCQCAATLAIIRRETNSWKWPVFVFTYMTVLAYVGALITYHACSAIGLA